jgi:predicted PurR-regulated permease PerM
MEKYQLEISYQTIFKIFFFILALVFLFYIQQVIVALFAAFVLSTVTNPMADAAEKRNLPRAASAPLIFIGVLAFVGIIFYWIIPSLIGELGNLIKHFPQYIIENTAKYPFLVQFNIGQGVDQAVMSVLNYINDQALNIFLSTVSVLSNVFYVFLSLAVAFYLTVEKNMVKLYLRRIMNRGQYKNFLPILDEIEVKMGRWFVGQVILSLVSGAAIFIGLTILGVPFALSLAILASILRFIPYLGGLISDVTGISIAFLSSPALGILTFFMYYLIQQIEAYILIPYVMQRTVGLNPIVVIVAVVAGGQLGGISGALLALPVAIILVILVKEFILKENNHLAAR